MKLHAMIVIVSILVKQADAYKKDWQSTELQ